MDGNFLLPHLSFAKLYFEMTAFEDSFTVFRTIHLRLVKMERVMSSTDEGRLKAMARIPGTANWSWHEYFGRSVERYGDCERVRRTVRERQLRAERER